MDALSEALNSVRMTGAIFYHAECTAPWGFAVPHLDSDVAHVLAPGTERLVSYHLVTEGKAIVRFDGKPTMPVAAGDVADHSRMAMRTRSRTARRRRSIDSGASLGKFLAGDLTTMRLGGGGEMTRFVCGYFGCERHADRLFLAGLPLMIKINIRGDAAGRVAGELDPPSGLRSGVGASGTVGAAVEDGGSALHRDAAPLHGAIAARADRLARRRARRGGRRRARADAPKPFHPWTIAELAAKAAPRAPFLRSGSRAFSASRR